MCLATVPCAVLCLWREPHSPPSRAQHFRSQFFLTIPAGIRQPRRRFRNNSGRALSPLLYLVLWQGSEALYAKYDSIFESFSEAKMGMKSKSLMQLCQHSESLEPMFPSIVGEGFGRRSGNCWRRFLENECVTVPVCVVCVFHPTLIFSLPFPITDVYQS